MMDKTAYELIKINESSWRIEEKSSVRSFLFAGADKALLIDSGYGTGDLRDEIGKITDLPVILVNTHADRDHIGCNRQFGKAYMHPAEFDRYSQASGINADALWEGDVIDLGTRRFEVILIPGHTPGSIALFDAENRVLVSGDSVQAGMIFMFGPGRNIGAYIHSMKKLSNMRGRFDTVYPSHGPFPVDACIINSLITGAERIRSGEIEGTKPPFDTTAKLYDADAAKFLYE